MLRRLLAASLLLLFAACGGPSATIGLEAHGVEDRSSTAGYAGGPDARLLAVRIRLLNATGATIPVTPSAFFLEPASGTSLVGHPLTASFSDGCGGALAPDRTITCSVGFDVPAGFVPVQIAFEHDGQRATAPVTLGRDAGPAERDAGGPTRRDAGPDFDAGRDVGPPPPRTQELDLLFMVDNSNSMDEEQASLIAQLPLLVEVLGTGDFDRDGSATGPEDFPPFDLHVGVVTSDMGSGGFTVPTCARSDFGDDGILRTQGRIDIAGCMATYPMFLRFRPSGGETPEEFAREATCVTAAGTGGCGFEQQLESILKALSPSAPTRWTAADYTTPSFFRNTFGHGDRQNDGFVRDDSVLAIVPVSDEEDCSVRDPELFNPSSAVYTADLNLRCFAHADAALYPLARFIDGYLQLRRHPSRLVFAPIVGIPADIQPTPGGSVDWPLLISEDPARRDDRMEERIDPAMPSRLQPSCNVPGRGVAYPPVRIARVAEAVERGGAHVTIRSICEEDFETSILEIIRQIRDSGAGG